jgi:hypothetical protein
MKKYITIEIKKNPDGLKGLLGFFWYMTKEFLIFMACIVLAVLMFTS